MFKWIFMGKKNPSFDAMTEKIQFYPSMTRFTIHLHLPCLIFIPQQLWELPLPARVGITWTEELHDPPSAAAKVTLVLCCIGAAWPEPDSWWPAAKAMLTLNHSWGLALSTTNVGSIKGENQRVFVTSMITNKEW